MNQTEAPFLVRNEVPDYLRSRWGIRLTKSTLQRMACLGGGPVYRRAGKAALYSREDVDDWVRSRLSAPLTSASDLAAEDGQAV